MARRVRRPSHVQYLLDALFGLDVPEMLGLSFHGCRDMIGTIRHIEKEPWSGHVFPRNGQDGRPISPLNFHRNPGHVWFPTGRKYELQRKNRISRRPFFDSHAGTEISDRTRAM
jgi:hypothetical protein